MICDASLDRHQVTGVTILEVKMMNITSAKYHIHFSILQQILCYIIVAAGT